MIHAGIPKVVGIHSIITNDVPMPVTRLVAASSAPQAINTTASLTCSGGLPINRAASLPARLDPLHRLLIRRQMTASPAVAFASAGVAGIGVLAVAAAMAGSAEGIGAVAAWIRAAIAVDAVAGAAAVTARTAGRPRRARWQYAAARATSVVAIRDAHIAQTVFAMFYFEPP